MKNLSIEEQDKLFSNWSNPENKEVFFNYHINLAHFIARKYENTDIEYDDRLQLALIGMWKATLSFEPLKGYKFTTYASRAMHNEILMALRKTKKKSQINNDIIVSLHYPIVVDEYKHELTLGDIIPDEKAIIDDHLLASELHEELIYFLDNKCTDKQRYVVIETLHNKSQPQIASELGVSQSDVSKTLRKFRKKFKSFYKEKSGV